MVEHGDLRFKQHVRDLYNIPILSLSIYIYTAYVYECPFKEKKPKWPRWLHHMHAYVYRYGLV